MEAVITDKKINIPLLMDLIKFSLYIGATAYGGPAIAAQIKRKIVEEKKWINEKEFLDALSFAQMLPGATFVTLMSYVGFKLKNITGALIVPFFFLLPTFAAIIILSYGYFHFTGHSYIISIFKGLGAMVVALLINAVYTFGKSIFPKISLKYYKGFLIASFVFSFSFWVKIDMSYLIITSGVLGFFFYYFTGETGGVEELRKAASDVENEESVQTGTFVKYGILIIILLLIILSLIIFPLLGKIFVSFFKIGMFSFGGYSSLPLMQHETIDIHHWLSLKEFSDGIAMGQITPGPLLITSAFIGYKVAGILGAIYAAASIFSPSILLVILLYKLHSTLTKLWVVKVIVKGLLAGFVGLLIATAASFGIAALINWQAWFIFALSTIALIKFKVDPVWIVLSTIVISLIIF